MNAPSTGTPGVTQLQVGAHVGLEVDRQAEDPAVAGGGDLDVLDHVAAVDGGLVALAARLGPLHRPAELAGDDEGDDLLGVHVELGAEAAADVGGDHPQLLLGDAGGQRQHQPQDVRDLGGRVDRVLVGRGESASTTTARGSIAVGMQPLLDVAALDDDAALGVGRRARRRSRRSRTAR